MPTEIRRLFFSNEEIIQAVSNYQQRGSDSLPSGRILELALVPGAALSATVIVQTPGDIQPKEASITTAALAAALIRWCMHQAIPLPRDARKTLSLESDGRLCLTLTIG